MSPTQRYFKLLCLMEMILGACIVVAGAALALSTTALYGAAGTLVLGVLAALAGFIGARAANVPVTVGKTRVWFALVFVLGVALVVAALCTQVVEAPIWVELPWAISALIALLALVLSGKVLKETDR